MVANAYLEGTYSEVYPHIGRDEDGLRQLFRQFSFPGGIPSHAAPRDAGLDQRGRRARLLARPRLRGRLRQPRPARRLRDRRRRGGDRCARDELALEQAPQPAHRRRGAADPAPQRLQDRQPDPARPHPRGRAGLAARGLRLPAARGRGGRAAAPSTARSRRRSTRGSPPRSRRRSTRSTRSSARRAPAAPTGRPRWPMIVLRTPKGWTGPKVVDGLPVEGTWRAHQVPLAKVRENPEHLRQLEEWMRSYRPEELFDERRGAGRRARRAGAAGRAADERQPPRQRRPAAARAAAAGLPRLRGRGGAAGSRLGRSRPACSAPSCAT